MPEFTVFLLAHMLEQELTEVESLAAEERIMIEKYRKAEGERITKRIHWLADSLEAFMREHNKPVGDKLLQLPHGQLLVKPSAPVERRQETKGSWTEICIRRMHCAKVHVFFYPYNFL